MVCIREDQLLSAAASTRTQGPKLQSKLRIFSEIIKRTMEISKDTEDYLK